MTRTAPGNGEIRRNSMQTVLIVIHLMIVLAMVCLVLLQKSEGGGLGIGSSGGFMTSRGTTNVLTRSTAILAACFFATSLLLSVLAGWGRSSGPLVGGAPSRTPISTPGQTPKVPDAPKDAPKEAPKAPQAPQSK
jgi:preprotein translocase subunit SecG